MVSATRRPPPCEEVSPRPSAAHLNNPVGQVCSPRGRPLGLSSCGPPSCGTGSARKDGSCSSASRRGCVSMTTTARGAPPSLPMPASRILPSPKVFLFLVKLGGGEVVAGLDGGHKGGVGECETKVWRLRAVASLPEDLGSLTSYHSNCL